MTPKADEVLQTYLDEQGHVRWPTTPEARAEVAQSLLWVRFIESCDALYGSCLDLAQNPHSNSPYQRPESKFARRDAHIRSVLATLNDDQRAVVLRLLHEHIYGSLLSFLLDLDQLPWADVALTLRQRSGDPPFEVEAVPGPNAIGIHEQWSWRLREFSAFPIADGD